MVATFYSMIQFLQAIGVADVLLPFLLVFTVSFAIFQKSRILGPKEEAKKFNVIVALVMGLAFIMPHILWGSPNSADNRLINGMIDPVALVNNSMPSISVVIIAILLVMMMLGIFGAEFNLGSGVNSWVMFLSLAVVVYVFGTNAGYFGNGIFPPWLWFLADPNTQSLLVVLLVFGIIVYFITSDPEKNKDKEKFSNYIKAFEGGGGKHP